MTDSEGPGPGDAQPKGEPEGRPEIDIDTAFAAIVADFSAPSPAGGGPWPASEDLDDDEPDDGSARPAAGTPDAAADKGVAGTPPDPGGTPEPGPERRDAVRRRIVLPGEDEHDDPVGDSGQVPVTAGRGTGRSDHVDGRAEVAADEDDEGYVPPEPPPLPRGDLVSRLAWGAVIGGPLFLLAAALTWRTLPSSLLLVALVAFVGGFVTLVARMPQDHPDDPDDGAVV